MPIDHFVFFVSFLNFHPIQILIAACQKGERLWYDFDLLKSECTFTIFRLGKLKMSGNLEGDEDETTHQRPASPTHRNQSTQHAQMIYDKPLIESQSDEVQRLISPIHCHDGDSVQQTFVCSQAGNYVLQWRHALTHHQTSPFDFISGSHKTKIMFHYQRLAPGRLSTDVSGNGHLNSEQQRTFLASS